LLLRENRRLTNLLLAKNPSAAIAAEKFSKPTKKEQVDPRIQNLTPPEHTLLLLVYSHLIRCLLHLKQNFNYHPC
jgi:hypothetical protein